MSSEKRLFGSRESYVIFDRNILFLIFKTLTVLYINLSESKKKNNLLIHDIALMQIEAIETNAHSRRIAANMQIKFIPVNIE